MYLRWTSEEIEFVRQRAPYMPCKEILKELNETFGCNRNIKSLHFMKHSRKIRSPKAGTFNKGKRNSIATEFKKGYEPWNKGIHYSAGGRSAETRFKKGNVPKNHRPIGSERHSYGKIMIKIGEPSVWENLATLVWQSVHKRALPPKTVIMFANGDITDYSPENLIAVSRAQLAVINHLGLHTWDAESLKAALLLADLKMENAKRKRGE